MSKKMKGNLIWFDMEMTGLDPFHEHVLEYSIVPTDKDLNIIDKGITLIVHQEKALLDQMDEWNINQHTKNGLVKSCLESTMSLQDTEKKAIKYILKYVNEKESPLCGNSIFHDKIFVRRLLPELNSVFHYRLIDISTIKEVVSRWYPDLPKFEKPETHRALDDVYQSIYEMKYYREKIMIPIK